MKILPSRDAAAIIAERQRTGILRPTPSTMVRAAPPPSDWWAIVTRHARSGAAHDSVLRELIGALGSLKTSYTWPRTLFETDDRLPPLGADQALIILGKFARMETGSVRAGLPVYAFHWEVLSAHFAPLQERWSVLKQFESSGLLEQANGTRIHQDSGLRWPLIITAACVKAVNREELAARLPTLKKVEEGLEQVHSTFPRTLQLLGAMVAGGAVFKAIEWLIGLF